MGTAEESTESKHLPERWAVLEQAMLQMDEVQRAGGAEPDPHGEEGARRERSLDAEDVRSHPRGSIR